MSNFIEHIRTRLAECQKKVMETNQALQSANLAHQAAMQDFQGWQRVLEAESKHEGIPPPPPAQVQMPSIRMMVQPIHQLQTAPSASPQPTNQEPMGAPEANKTEIIRDLLQRNLGGLTPAEIWHAVKNEIPRRNYVYAVLGRLKERDHVGTRRGRYYWKAKPTEDDKTMTP